MDNEKKQDMNSVSAQQYYYPPMIYPQDDEINLLDIWRILAKRKKLIIIISLLVTLGGSAYAISKPDIYAYSTAIQIGSSFVDGKEEPVENAKNAQSKVKEVYIASVLSDYYSDKFGQAKNIKIDVSLPKDSEVLIIRSNSPEQQGQIYQQLITRISAKLVESHREKINEFRAELSEQILNAKKRLELIEVREKELNKRIEGFDKAFKASPIDNSGTTALVMTELFQQQYQISSEKYALQSQIVNKLSRLNLIQDTKLLYPVTKSSEPVGFDKKIMIAAFALAGLMLGVFISLVRDFVEKTKSQLATGN
jgi:uncharacterized protein involved in exopolysaccharide biosynthesis